MKFFETKEKFKQSYQRFSDGTSMHGFTELFYAKTFFWKLIWFLIVLAAICVTIYQVIQAVNNYIHQTSSTLIQPATDDQVKYPPLKFCVAHWIYWIYWHKLFSKGFTKETVLYGMSYLSDIYSKDHFNVTDSSENFTLLLKENNITNMTDFYTTFAIPFGYFGEPDIFNHTEFIVADLNNPYFCYTVTGDEIKSYLNKKESEINLESSQIQKNTITLSYYMMDKQQIDDQEYNSYMAQWIYDKTIQYVLTETDFHYDYTEVRNNYSLVVPPNIMYVDGYSSVNMKLLPQIDEYFITIKASSRKWKNSKINKCLENVASVLSDTSCSQHCLHLSKECQYAADGYDFVSNTLLKNNTEPSMLKKYKIHFLNKTQQSTTWSTNFEQTLGSSLNAAYDKPASIVTTVLSSNLSTSLLEESKTGLTTYLPNDENSTFISNTSSTENDNDYQGQINVAPCNWSLVEIAYNTCLTEKCKTLGCELWTFDVTVTTRSLHDIVKDVAKKYHTTMYINYPSSDEVLIMTETDSKTWEDFVGNVGGLFGIWTGASVISIFQIFYLCCCANMEGGHFSFAKWWKRQRSRNDFNMETKPLHNQNKRLTSAHRRRPLKRIKTIIINPYNVVGDENNRFGNKNRSRPVTMKLDC